MTTTFAATTTSATVTSTTPPPPETTKAPATTPPPTPIVDCRGIVRAHGGRRILDEVALAVAPAERVAILGPSGSGKTTLLRLIAGLDAPDAGEIWIDGVLASDAGRVRVAPHRRGIGVVFQSAALWPHMTAAQNVAFAIRDASRAAMHARAGELLGAVGLAGLGDRYPDQLSGGEARRVALARALAADPRLLLMDEPLTNLDVDRRTELLALIDRMVAASGASLIYVTHEAGEAAALARRVLMLEAGRVAIVGR